MTEIPQGPTSTPPQPPAEPTPPVVPIQPPPAKKPGKVTAISIMVLVSGIWNCLSGLGWLFTVIGIPVGAYCIVVGILEIIYATKILSDPMKVSQPARYVAIMEIVNIVSFSVSSLVVGILSLVFYSDPAVANYFESRPAQAA